MVMLFHDLETVVERRKKVQLLTCGANTDLSRGERKDGGKRSADVTTLDLRPNPTLVGVSKAAVLLQLIRNHKMLF